MQLASYNPAEPPNLLEGSKFKIKVNTWLPMFSGNPPALSAFDLPVGTEGKFLCCIDDPTDGQHVLVQFEGCEPYHVTPEWFANYCEPTLESQVLSTYIAALYKNLSLDDVSGIETDRRSELCLANLLCLAPIRDNADYTLDPIFFRENFRRREVTGTRVDTAIYWLLLDTSLLFWKHYTGTKKEGSEYWQSKKVAEPFEYP